MHNNNFSKFTDMTLGSALLFLAGAGVARYFVSTELAIFIAAAAVACVILLRSASARKRRDADAMSARTEEMFYDFMFLAADGPARLLARALSGRGLKAVRHGSGVYVNGTAAYFCFDAAPGAAYLARAVSRAARYGAKNIIIFCKRPPDAMIEVEGVSISAVHGDDVFRLFASLGALPEHKYAKPKRRRFTAIKGALGMDRALGYLILTSGLLGVTAFIGYSPVVIVCAVISAALLLATVLRAAAKRLFHG